MHYLSGNEASVANDNPRTGRPINPIFLKEKGVEIAVHYTQEQIDRANAVDIFDYARSQGLEMKREGKDWRVKNYPGGFMITPEKNTWNWFVESKGGGVVQLCMFLENKTWPEAIGTLLNEDMTPIRHAPDWKPAKEPPKEFILPERNDTNKHVYAYLTKTRGLDADIVKNMLDNGYIYENKYRSCVFVGRDTDGVPRHASVRSTNTSGNTYKKDVSGSQKKYSFSVPGTSGVLNVFEAPIDALSYMSMQKQAGKPLEDSYLALGGVSDKALARYLADFPDIQRIRICTDGDEAGDRAAGNMMNTYGKDYAMERIRPVHKDFNEDLLASQVENIEKPENLLINSLTGKLISSELAGVLSRLNQDIYVPLEEILDTPEIRLAESIISDATPTEKIEHREELQAHVLEQLEEIGSAVIDSNGNVAYNGNVAKGKRLDIIVGLPASGKSSVFADTISQIYQSRLIDSDEAKKLIPEYNDGWGSSVVHEESKKISNLHLRECRLRGENIVLPKVGSNISKMQDIISEFKNKGYQVYCHYVDLSREKTLARMLTRFLTDGRYLRPVLIDKYNNRQVGNKIEAVYEALKKGEMLNGYSKWSNDVRQGEQPVLIENECGGEFYERITETYSGIDRGYGGAGRYSGGPDQSGNQGNRIGNLGQTEYSNRNENLESDIQGSQIYPRQTGRNGSAAMGRLEFGNQGGLSEQDIYGGGYGTREEQYGGTGGTGAREIDNNTTENLPEKSFAARVDDVLAGKANRYNDIKVCDTPEILLEAGCRQLPVFYTQKHLRDALRQRGEKGHARHYHSLQVEQIKKLPEIISKPVMIYDSLSSNDSVVIVTSEIDNKGCPIIAVIRPNGNAVFELEIIESNFMLSVYGKQNIANQITRAIEDNKMLYCNKQKSQELFSVLGLQSPQGFNNLDFDKIIHPSRNIVNQKFAETGEERSQTVEQEKIRKESVENDFNTAYTRFLVDILGPEGEKTAQDDIATDSTEHMKQRLDKMIDIIGSEDSAYITREVETTIESLKRQLDQMEENFPMPDSDAEPIVTILWSEHSRFHDGETMSLSEANAVMERLDETTAKEDGYYKTKFRIDFVMGGQPNNYIGRQDLGDGDGTLINHIEKYYAGYENNAEWDNYILRNKGKEALEEDKAQRQMLLHEFVPYLKLHENLSKMERTAAQTLQEKETMTSTETAYYAAIKEYVSQCRNMVNSGEYDLPPAPQIKDFDTELEAYKEHVKEEIAQEAATAGMTTEEYATNGYEPLPDPPISIKDVLEEDKKTYVEAEYDNYLQIVSKDGNSLKDVPKEYYTEELLLAAVKNWGAAIKYIPENLLTQELALASVRQYGLNLRNIPPQLRSEEVCIAAYISSGGRAISYVPKDSREKVKQEALKQMSVDNEIYSENQLKVAQLQQQGQEWANQIENILKEHEDNPEAIVEDIAFAAKFYNYSIKNIQIMHMQNPYITYVASASAYEKMGYHVKPGEQALAARVPLLSKYVLNEKKEPIYANQYTEEIKQKVKQGVLKEQQRVTGFRFVSAFYDISQTDCPVEDYPSIYQVGIPSARHQEAFEAMKEFAESIGFQVNVTDLQSIALRGDCDPVHKIIRINDKLESTVALSTLCHEIAHGIIHTSNDRKKTTEAQRECEADVMDVMLESSMGLPISPNRTEHIYANFHKYKNEQAAKERPYEVTLEKLIDRVQTKVFRPYAEEIKRFLEQHLPEKGYDAEARETVNDLAMLASAYDRDYLNLIDSSNPLFASKVEDYREQYMQAKEKIRLDNSFVPKLAIWKYIGEPAAQQMYEVQLPDARTIELIKEHPDELTPSAFPYNVEEGDILSLKQNVLEDSDFYKVCQSGLINITDAIHSDFTDTYAEQKINAGFDCLKEYQCLDRLLKKDIPIEKVLMKYYEYLKAALGKQLLEPVTDTDLLESGKKEAYVRVLSSTSDQIPKDRVYSIYDFKSCMDKACASESAFPAVMYKLVTKQGNEIQSYIDIYKENTGQNVYEQLYSKVQNENPELSRIISRQYYRDQADFAFMDSNERLQEEIKRLDLAPADAELLKLNAGNMAEQLSSIGQTNQQMQQRQQQKQQVEQTI